MDFSPPAAQTCRLILASPPLPCYNAKQWHNAAQHGKEHRIMAAAIDRISAHEVRLLLAFQQQADGWLANGEVAEAAQISPRTATLHTSRLVEVGVLDVERVH